jgi:glycosyltransferase involved in cell wall biosynthesis
MTSSESSVERSGRLAILHPSGAFALGRNPFGKDVANLQLWRALAHHGGYAGLDVLTATPVAAETLATELFGGRPPPIDVTSAVVSPSRPQFAADALLRGLPNLSDLAWGRRRAGQERRFSLLGMVHTIAPPELRQRLAMMSTAPLYPWDALICTSPCVRDALERMFAEWGEHLAERTGGRPPPHPALPLVPLGVDAAALAALADRSEARARIRAELGLEESDVLVLWVGRLSYYEKAYPQPMFQAVQRAHALTGARLAFVMVGWFPEAGDRALYEAAARAHAPDVAVTFADGNDQQRLGDLWAAADIFLSLVDNIQETFGITPLEAMAAGVPVVVSDWDGYRFTVRDGVEGFRVPTLIGPAAGGVGAAVVENHLMELTTYQGYVGAIAQHTAVHIGRAARALADLIGSPDLRLRIGAAGRARVREAFDWPVVARQIHDLTDELGRVRAAAAGPQVRVRADPVKGDPFVAFAPFATHALGLDSWLTAAPGASAEALRGPPSAELDGAFPGLRAPRALCADALSLIAERGGMSVRDVLLAFPTPERRRLEMGLAWMAKYGFLDWLP